jgi:hypothetical protein
MTSNRQFTGADPAAPPPTLVFEDVQRAVSYYRDELGFDTELARGGKAEASVRMGGATIRLRQARAGEFAGGKPVPCGDDVADAVVLVDRPYRLFRHLEDHGGHSLDVTEPGLGEFFKIGDYAGNVLAIGPTRGMVPAVRRLLQPTAVDTLQINRQNRRNAREEAPHLRGFQAFYEKLPEKRNICYMFFTGDLLHWVAKAASYVPDDVNLVVIGSALPEYDVQWLRDELRRPFHHVSLRIDDNTAWEFLLATNEYNFTWLDIDCLVLNDQLFDEMLVMAPDTCVNAVWWQDSGFGSAVASTYFMTVNVMAERALRKARIAVSPNMYSRRPFNRRVAGRRCYSDVLTRRQRRRLLKILPADDSGQPSFAGERMTLYDTMVVHQLMARTVGFGANPVRRLARRSADGAGSSFEEISDEIIHIGGVSYAGALSEFSRFYHAPPTRLRYLLADYVALLGAAGRLPDRYAERHDLVVRELAKSGLTPGDALDAARRHLTQERGLCDSAARAVIGQQPVSGTRTDGTSTNPST